ncbi:MAG: HEAT repeat domain-containing protein [Planctomycetes bacterium]|nr:HEAT repeat domain-containing protein [Planctomycetota bacterium]
MKPAHRNAFVLFIPFLFVAFARAQTPASAPATLPAIDSGAAAWVDRVYDLKHLDFDLWFDLEKRTVRGTVAQTLAPICNGVKELPFDAEEMRILRATVDGGEVSLRTTDKKVYLQLREPAKAGADLKVTLQYEAWPTTGLHWGAPEPGYESKWYQCYSQGEGEDNHHWIPLHDYPNDRATWDCTLHVANGYVAVANGAASPPVDDPGGKTRAFHYSLEQPNVTYLISVAIGPWERFEDRWNDVAVEYYVARGVGEERARRSFGKTPAMIDFFSSWTGVPYPYVKYSQTAVEEFVVGGMENVSATTQTDTTLHDARSHLERDSDGLVAHELVHQWWGDLLTCNGWRHLWLNEGFATYFTALWFEHEKGLDGYRLYMDGQRSGFLAADPVDAPRPMVTSPWARRGDGANAHVYTKGSSVLHMLRFVVGDELFQKSLSAYAKKHALQLVETRDLERVVADVTGRGLEWFWQEWVYMQGAPALEISQSYDSEKKMSEIVVKQTQKISATTPIFKMPVDVLLGYADGRTDLRRVWIDAAENKFNFSVPERPAFINFDEGSWLTARVTFEKPVAELAAQAELDPDVVARRRACQQIGTKLASADEATAPLAVAALVKKLKSKDHYEVAAAAAAALKNKDSKESREALTAALKATEPSVRRSAADSLGGIVKDKDITICEELKRVAVSDRAYGVQSAATRALTTILGAESFDFAKEMTQFASERDAVRIAALDCLQQLDPARALPALLEAAKAGNSYELRSSVLSTLSSLQRDEKRGAKLTAADRESILAATREAAKSNYYRLRTSAIAWLGRFDVSSTGADLDRIIKEARDARDKRAAEGAQREQKARTPKQP